MKKQLSVNGRSMLSPMEWLTIIAAVSPATACLSLLKLRRLPWFLETNEAERVLAVASSYAIITVDRLSELTSLADSSTVMIVEALIEHGLLKATFDRDAGLIRSV